MKTKLVFICISLSAFIASAAQISDTFDSNSNPEFGGEFSISFSSANSSDWSPSYGGEWYPAYSRENFINSFGDQAGISFVAGAEDPQSLNLYAGILGLTVDGISMPQTFLDNSSSVSPGSFLVGSPSTVTWENIPENESSYFDTATSTLINYEFSYDFTVAWNGTSGIGNGNWSLQYNVTPQNAPAPVPEPKSTALIGIGLTMGFFRHFRKMRQQI